MREQREREKEEKKQKEAEAAAWSYDRLFKADSMTTNKDTPRGGSDSDDFM